ncbi:hypothetical protein [Herbaspirillum sp. SJZ107]|uniref:hypothetical protein n=1 Tax=Herbaspirillum sp. SJZ107 TaxID=2572881 RepID=UPI00115499FF|nr:hypothetical protein [Herbaspirillum sp. SJZ107]TQK11290.1 hypothetical protein FBX97_1228 [Herbaspirillum sp. SJZ107]
MIKLNHASGRTLDAARTVTLAAGVLGVLCAGPVQAAPKAPKATAASDVLADFHLLAQQRPWTCATPSALPNVQGIAAGDAACAWQNRLSRRSWTWSGDAAASCISHPARWWAWAQSALPPQAVRSVWHANWNSHATLLAIGEQRRLLLVRRERGGQWAATEWRWDPNPRPATRRWQQGRWQALVDAAARGAGSSPPQSAAVAPDTTRLQAVFAAVLGGRAGEIGSDGMAMDAGGLCIGLSNPLPGQSTLPLSYNAADSRLEQRAASHLQLSRQFPNAVWLTPFKLLALPAAPAAGAKYLATWLEGDDLKSQLWMPARGDGRAIRVRMSTRLAPGLGAHPEAAPVVKARQAVEHELEALAAQWAVRHE